MSWPRHLKIVLATFIGIALALYLFVLAMNPYGNLPNWAFASHVMTDDNQRFQYPSVARSGRYDSLVMGTSTARLLKPAAFEAILGGRFANLAMNAGTAWEQTQLVELFVRHTPRPHALVAVLDYPWCVPDADRARVTFRGFPEWMYDTDPWNDLFYTFNSRAVEISVRRLWAAVSGRKPRLPDNGYQIFTPPESAYDRAKVKFKLYGTGPARPPSPVVPPVSVTAAQREAWRFPALPWLEQLITAGRWRHAVVVFAPVHVTAQPTPGSLHEQKEAECKRRVARIGARHAVPVIDFRIRSSLTAADDNFWDPLHFRIGIATRITDGIATALQTREHDHRGDWRILSGGWAAHMNPE